MASGVKLSGNWRKLNRHMQLMKNFKFTPVHQEIGEMLTSSTRERFSDQKAPDGKSWEKSYRAKEEGGVTLTDNATLKNSVNFKAKAEGVAVGTNLKYAAIHQFGGTIKAKKAKFLKFKAGKRWALKKKVTIPAREFIGISSEDRREIKRILLKHLRKALK